MTGPSDITPDPGSVAGILAASTRLGITLQVAPGSNGGKVRFRPRSAMTPDLADRIKAHRSALLAVLSDRGADTTPKDEPVNADGCGQSGVASVVSVSEPDKAIWSEDELAILGRAGKTPADLPLMSAVKGAFADFGATVVSVEAAHGRGGWTRRRVAELIRDARMRSTGEAVAMRDAWRERLAVCTIDGGMTDDCAEQVALNELERILYSQTS